MRYIDFRSDTVTKPTEEMKEAMAKAIVGDDVFEDDPTIKELEKYGADLLGKEASIFVPSGTFANQVAIMTHTSPGDEVIVGEQAHILENEAGAAQKLSGVGLRPIDAPRGVLNPDEVKKRIRGKSIHVPKTGLICMENAHSSGRVVGLENMKEIKALADDYNIPLHLDGARLFNASTALGLEVKDLSACADSINICLSKGLGAPIGSLLVGNQAFINRVRKNRKIMGGAMRQVGLLGAAGLVALKTMTKRLDEDHKNAKLLAEKLAEIGSIEVLEDRLDINMVFFKLPTSIISEAQLIIKLLEKRIKILGKMGDTYRLVTHNDIKEEDVEYFANSLKEILSKK